MIQSGHEKQPCLHSKMHEMKMEACFTVVVELHFLNLQDMLSEESRFGSLHLHLQPLEMQRVGVVFTPADYGKVTSLILIR